MPVINHLCLVNLRQNDITATRFFHLPFLLKDATSFSITTRRNPSKEEEEEAAAADLVALIVTASAAAAAVVAVVAAAVEEAAEEAEAVTPRGWIWKE